MMPRKTPDMMLRSTVPALRIMPSLRIAAASFAVTAAVLTGIGSLQAQAIAGFNSSAPVNYAADRIELQDKQKRVVLSGNVDIGQGDLRLRAARTTVAYTDDGNLKIQRIDATGGVQVARGNETARGDVAIYDFNARIITMSGNVQLNRGSDVLRGGRMVIDLGSGISTIDGHGDGAGGRVSGSFTVPKS